MALPNTDIRFGLVNQTIKGGSFDDFTLCTHPNINRWSRKKPVRGPFPQGDNGKFGIVIADWSYNTPRGQVYNEPGRIDDFRGYEHDKTIAFPPVHNRPADNTQSAKIYPSSPGNPYMFQWLLRGYENFVDPAGVLIKPSEIGIGDYYCGVRIGFGGVTSYKTFGMQVKNLDAAGSGFSVSAELVTWSGTPAYANFPNYGIGVAQWTLFISTGQTIGWQQGAPAGMLFLPTVPEFCVNTGSFEVTDWVIVPGVTDLYFLGSQAGAGVYQGGNVYACSIESTPEFTLQGGYPSWLTVRLYDNGAWISHPNLWFSGNEVRIYPNSTLGSGSRDGYVTFLSPGGSSYRIHVTQYV